MGRAQRLIGGIQPFAELAQSATTVVYKGYQREPGRFVLLKVLRPGLGHDEERVRRFEDEARLVAQVQHPNVVAIYASGRDDGQSYLAAEFVDGFDLRGLVERGALPPELAAFVVLEAARGLRAAHGHGILHRDLKPSNILVSHDGQVKLTDFGMASLLDDDGGAEVRGTPGYLAPELVRGAPPTKASDLFSLGATFYEALAGRAAFHGADTGALLDAVLHHDPLPRLERFVDLPPEMRRICARLLEKDPAARYPAVEALIADLETLQATREAATGAVILKLYLKDPDAYRSTRSARAPAAVSPSMPVEARRAVPSDRPAPRRRVRWAWGGALAVLLVGGLGGGFLLRDGPPAPSQPVDVAEEAAIRLPAVDTSGSALPDEPDEEADDGAPSPPPVAALEPDDPAAGVPAQTDSLPAPLRSRVDTTSARSPADASSTLAGEPVEAVGRLSVAVQPWAEVFVGGERKGQVPPNVSLSLPVGTHRITLKNPQFPEYTGDVEVRAGEEETLTVRLWDLVGRLTIDAQPWAEVFVDNQARDVTPVHDLVVWAGERRLTLRHPELGAWDTTLVVRGGETRTLRFNLTNKRLRQ